MKILVLGGSYFYGRVFTMLASKSHEITVLNRGTYSMESFGVKQIKGDRHDENTLEHLAALDTEFDVVVDFCGYEPKDVASIVKHLPGKTKQYIFISTVDVYKRGIQELKKEDAPYETRSIEGEAGEYIRGKIALEQELKMVCQESKMAYTILRPAVLYGPYNYAPRESVFIQIALQNHVLPEIIDATGKFQFTYVKDGAEAIEKCLLNENVYGQAYNLCGDEILDYEKLIVGLEQAIQEDLAENGNEQSCHRIQMTVKEAAEQGIPLPFAVYEEETELYSNEKSKKELGLVYTSFQEGMKKTCRAFKGVFG